MEQNQFLSIALASVPTMLTVLVGILINNSRLSDMNARITELRYARYLAGFGGTLRV
jgi:hypothetical protein